uniref:Uncharacterized protein n=1 Tax=Strombidium inclinatum TaxID=197538 RepID=A0A7S3IW85_9SPIT|mmetsp:Transcript_39692/g.60826  ORF Transcript_39692/g.60826 Transcript_39692/m.60826 type:complete len:164 (+) Transcript_39692:1262-1753(+)
MAFCTFSYYLINFEVKYMTGSMVRNTLVSQTAEFLSTLGGGLIYYKLGARYGLSSQFVLTIIGSVFLIKYGDNEKALPIIIVLTKFGATAALTMVYIANVKLIPTKFSTTVFGFWNVLARSVNSLSPLLSEMQEPTPMIVNICISAVAAVMSMLLVEKMPDFR